MKKSLLIIVSSIFLFASYDIGQAQEAQVGDVFTIEAPADKEYQFIFFPRKNFIIKQGGTPDLKMVRNLKVVVVAVEYRDGNKTLVTLKRKDGGRFFRGPFRVKADLDGALTAGELSS